MAQWFKRLPNSGDYAPVPSDNVDQQLLDECPLKLEKARNGFHDPSRRGSMRNLIYFLPWITTLIFATLYVLLLVRPQRHTRPGTYETNFETDFLFPSQIPLEKIRFRGTPHFYNNGTPWAEPPDEAKSWPENTQYVGEPNPQVDANWRRLIGQRYFSLSEQEATRAWGSRRHEFVDQNAGGYTAGFDMFHTLHCLNELRKSLHPEYYFPNEGTPARAAFHNDHCIEILRQTVQCYGSTTLIPTRYIDGIEHNYIDSDQEHVCRSISFIRDFTSSRARGEEGYVPRDQSLVNEMQRALAKAWGAKYGNNEKSGSA